MSIYFQINKDMDPSQKRILQGQWQEICNQRAEMEDSKNAPMKNLLLNTIGYTEGEGHAAQQVIGNQLVTVNTGLTPADAFEKDKTELETFILAEVGPNLKLRLLLE